METLAPFIHTGLSRHERCFCILPPDRAHELVTELERRGVDVKTEISRSALLLAIPDETYLSQGIFDKNKMMQFLESAVREAVELGFAGFRAAGDMSWACRDSGICAQLAEYESMVEQFYPQRPALGLCMYDVRLFEHDRLQQLVRSHHFSLAAASESTRSIRMRDGNAFGDVIFDRYRPSLFHYKVQTDNSPQLITVGQELTLDGALDAVKSSLRLARNEA